MLISLEEFLEAMTTAENLVKVRRNGFCYLEPSKMPMASTIAASVGINFEDWLNRYFDYDSYN